jgi:CrcB protein
VKLILFIAAGGAVGAVGRYSISTWITQRASTLFPWGTIAVNVIGCLLMGVLTRLLLESNVGAEYRMAILVGVLGALTTFSTFSMETFNLLNDGQWGRACGYVLGMNAACFFAVWIGYRLTERLHT